MPKSNHIETKEIIATLQDNGILYVYIKPHVEITVQLQEEWVEIYNALTDVKRPFIFESGAFLSITKEARKNSRVIESKAPIISTGMVIKNLAQRLLADFYFHLNKNIHPTKIFKSKIEAEKWSLEREEAYTKETETNA